MNKNVAAMALGLVVVMTLVSGQTRRVDRALFRVESALRDSLDDRLGVEATLEIQRKYRLRPHVCAKA